MRNRYLYLLLLLSLILLQCKKPDDPGSNPSGNNNNNNGPRPYQNGVWVVNEGNFNYGNGTLSFLFRSDGQVVNDVFPLVNKRPLGDVFQSMSRLGNEYYMVINNSQRIEVADENMKSKGTIEGFTSPRYFLALNDQLGYVTDLSANGIWVVNPSQRSITSKIDYKPAVSDHFAGWTEQLLAYEGKVFVCGVKGNEAVVIDTKTNKISNTIPVGIDPQWMVMDGNYKLWVLCNGSLQKKASALYRIDPVTEKVEKTFTFSSTTMGPSALTIDAYGSELYYLYNGVYKMSVDTTALPAQAFIPAENRQLYGLGIDPRSGDIYVSDALDYSQKGVVYRYSGEGKLKQSFTAGTIPGHFVFAD